MQKGNYYNGLSWGCPGGIKEKNMEICYIVIGYTWGYIGYIEGMEKKVKVLECKIKWKRASNMKWKLGFFG